MDSHLNQIVNNQPLDNPVQRWYNKNKFPSFNNIHMDINPKLVVDSCDFVKQKKQ
jgi:hypothetical protein